MIDLSTEIPFEKRYYTLFLRTILIRFITKYYEATFDIRPNANSNDFGSIVIKSY